MALTPSALRTSLVVAVVRIRLALAALPSPSAFALAVRLATEALLRNLRARPKTRPAGCTPPALHGYTPRTDYPVSLGVRSRSAEDQAVEETGPLLSFHSYFNGSYPKPSLPLRRQKLRLPSPAAVTEKFVCARGLS
jgi:hypothetical protein